MGLGRALRSACLGLLVGVGGVDAARALSCVPEHPDPEVLLRTRLAEASVVFIGELLEAGREVRGPWSAWVPGRLKAERWFKGAEAPELRVLLRPGFRPGARLLVFARANTLDDRLMLARFRPDGSGPVDAHSTTRAADLPGWTAGDDCMATAYALTADSFIQHPGAADEAAVASVLAASNTLLAGLQTLPPAGSGGRLELMLHAYGWGDFSPRAKLRAEIQQAGETRPQAPTLRGPSTLQPLSMRWRAPEGGAPQWVRDGLPAGEYRLEGLRAAGFVLYCAQGSGPDCERIVLQDRGVTRHELTYLPDANLQVRLVDSRGLPVQGQGPLTVRRISENLPDLPFADSREVAFVAHRPANNSAHSLSLSAGRYAIEWLQVRAAPMPSDAPSPTL